MKERILTKQGSLHPEMLMDIIICKLDKGEQITFKDDINETAFLLLSGNITIKWDDQNAEATRSNVFDDMPYCLHVSVGKSVVITANEETEIMVQKTENTKEFPAVYYAPNQLEERILGGDQYQGTARRVIRDIFAYENAPYSNMVLGEVIHFPGRWSSWPPHSHEQPEVYYYKFDKPQGFGISVTGDDAKIVKDGDISAIIGGVNHPQVAGPGYAMYFAWMIRHLENNPWTSRDFDSAHLWMNEPDAKFWER